jgi:hypothetical protein
MAISEIYNADSTLVSISSTAQTALMELRSSGTTSKRAWIMGVRLAVGTTAAVASNNVLFTLARAGNAPSGGTAVTLGAQDPAAPTAITAAFRGSWTTAPTVGTILAEWELPQASGSLWVEYPPPGAEWVLPVATASIAVFVTTSVATATPVQAQFIVSE